MKAISSKTSKIKFFGNLVGAFAIVLATVAIYSIKARAYVEYDVTEHYYNESTGNEAYIFDGGNYLSSSEEANLIEKMESLTEYTSVIYITDENNVNYSMSYSEGLAKHYANEYFGSGDNVFVYVCDNEYDYIFVKGSYIEKTISKGKCDSIADNIYRYAADGRYYDGAVEAFREAERLCEGKAIAEPMKFICNAFIGLFVGFIVCYAIVSKKSKLKAASYDEMLAGAISFVETSGAHALFTNQTRVYSPRSSSSGGHGGHGGGGHGGGGHGGGHSH